MDGVVGKRNPPGNLLPGGRERGLKIPLMESCRLKNRRNENLSTARDYLIRREEVKQSLPLHHQFLKRIDIVCVHFNCGIPVLHSYALKL